MNTVQILRSAGSSVWDANATFDWLKDVPFGDFGFFAVRLTVRKRWTVVLAGVTGQAGTKRSSRLQQPVEKWLERRQRSSNNADIELNANQFLAKRLDLEELLTTPKP